MEGRKLRRQLKEEKKPKKVKVIKEKVKKDKIKKETIRKEEKSNKLLNGISRGLMLLVTVVILAVIGTVIYLKVLPNKYIIPLCIGAVLTLGIGIFMVFTRKGLKIFRIITSALSVILIGIFTFAGLKLIKTMDFLGDMTTETVNAKTYSVVVLKDSTYTKLEDVQYRLLLYYDTELNKNQEAITKLTDVMTVVAEKTDNVHELANKLISKDVDAILIEDSYYAIIEEDIEDFKEKITVIYTFTLEDTIQTIAKDVSVTTEPFNVYISGIDSYGKISSVARSDVNMVVSVNPKTKQVLLINIPRDYYVKLHGTSGYRDKLTHAGIYGIDMSVKTVEDLLDIDINYYVRVNFTSLINIIDAIGGINVYSEYAFTSRIGKYKFVKGYNQMNGKQALGFARERYSFKDGDRMRGKNQQAVIDAVIEKVSSSSTMLTKFDALLDSLKGSFQTNMDYTKMIELVRMQISDNAEWNVTSIGIDGSGSMERTYSMGKRLLSVLIPYAGSVNKAETMIKDVLAGVTLEKGNINISKYNDYLVVSRGVYEEEEKPEEKPEEIPEKTPEENVPDSGEGNTQTPPTDSGNTDNGGSETPPPTDSGNTGGETPPPEDAGSSNEGTTPPTDSGSTDSGTTDNGGTEVPPVDSGNTDSGSTDSGNTETPPPADSGNNSGNTDNGNTNNESSQTPPSAPENNNQNNDSAENSGENTVE